MSSIDSRDGQALAEGPTLRYAKARVDHARDRFNEFQMVLGRFLSIDEHKIRLSHHLNLKGEVVFKGERPEIVIPESLLILTGEIVVHLRTALDYLVHELAWLDQGFEPTAKQKLQFPIFREEEGFWTKRKSIIGPLNDDHASAIEEFQPYKGARWAGILADLSNFDKHRRLIRCFLGQHTEPVVEQRTPDIFYVGMRARPVIFIGESQDIDDDSLTEEQSIDHALWDIGRNVAAVLSRFDRDFPTTI